MVPCAPLDSTEMTVHQSQLFSAENMSRKAGGQTRKQPKSLEILSPSSPNESLLTIQEIPLPQLRKLAEEGCLYAILDACDQPLIPPKMQDLGETKALSLFKGSAQEDYWAIAPYLARVDVLLLRWLYEHLWEQSWGIFVLSKANLEELHQHFRKYLVVKLPEGKNWFFRFYDPNILAMFLPTCGQQQLTSFCGPVRAFAVCTDIAGTVRLFQNPSTVGPAQSGILERQIKLEQYDALAQASLNHFVEKLTVHLKYHFPDQCRALGRTRLEAMIHYGIRNAATYNIQSETAVSQYLWLMFVAGQHFDQDPRMHWAKEILLNRDHDPEIRLGLIADRIEFQRSLPNFNE